MIKVVIAEDEFLVRLGLQSIIDWEAHGFHVLGAAASGLEALTICEKDRPDIIISDLKMPGMDGIELIRRIKSLGYNTRFIILTCHTDFSYMQEAIRLGVTDYLVKATMEPEELLSAMLKIKETLVAELADARALERMQNQQREHLEVARKDLLIEFLSGTVCEHAERNDFYVELGFASRDEPCSPLFMEIDHCSLPPAHTGQERAIHRRAILHAIESCIPKTNFLAPIEGSGIVCILRNGVSVKGMLGELRKKLKDLLDVTLSAVVFESDIPALRLPEAYQSASRRLPEKVFYDAPFTLTLSIDNPYRGQESGGLSVRDLLGMIGEKQGLDARTAFVAMLTRLRTERDCLQLLGELLSRLQDIWASCHDGKQDTGESRPRWVEAPRRFDSLDRLAEWLSEQFCPASSITAAENKTLNAAIPKAVQHIRENAMRNLTLSEVAGHVHMSVSHFSHVFKIETGHSFVSYCNELRVERAKLLLCTTNHKISAISRMVGFDDESYFIRVFRQSTGKTPIQFRTGEK